MTANRAANHHKFIVAFKHQETGARNRTQKAVGAIGIAVLAVCYVAHGKTSPDLAKARQLQSTQHYSRAIEAYREVLQSEPGAKAAWRGLGQSNLALGRASAARADFAHWRHLDPTDPYASIWLYLASARAHAHDAQRALTVPRGTAKWPLPVIRYLAGRTDWQTMLNHALDAPHRVRSRELCEGSFFLGEDLLAVGKMEPAMEWFAGALSRCAPGGTLRALAHSEYQRLYRAGHRERPEE
jgi:tetratricopeptide (TPR) repeat protein